MTKIRVLALALVVSLLGACSSAPAQTVGSPDSKPRQLAQTITPQEVRADASTKLAQAPKPEASPRKKRHNGDPEEPVKRTYAELLKNPAELGFKPTENDINRIYYRVREGFVEDVGSEALVNGVKAEVAEFVTQAKLDPAGVKAIPSTIKFEELTPAILKLYGDKVNKDLLSYVIILGMLDGTKDHYSVLMTPKEYGKLQEQMQAVGFGGIGIYIELDKEHNNALTIFEPIDGTPAAKAGLESGDRIVKIDGKSTDGITLDQAQNQIRGTVGSSVIITVDRKGAIKDFSVARAEIKVKSVTHRMFPNDIGYIRLRMFGGQTAEELDQAVADLKAKGAKGLVLDLRNNGGGYIDAARDVVGEFSQPNSLVVYTLDRNQRRREYKSINPGKANMPMVCLINEFSASASEITAGALRDHKLATLVGDHSFGKGSVQQLYPFPDGSALKLTIARFFTPGGSVIDKQGIEPNVALDMEPRFVGKVEQDTQLKKALEILNDKMAGSN